MGILEILTAIMILFCPRHAPAAGYLHRRAETRVLQKGRGRGSSLTGPFSGMDTTRMPPRVLYAAEVAPKQVPHRYPDR